MVLLTEAEFQIKVNEPEIWEKGPLSPDTSQIVHPEWTEEEEKQLVRRLDRLVMPLLMLGFFALQLDRGNM